MLDDLEKQLEEDKEVAPPAEAKLKTHNQVTHNSPCPSPAGTAGHLTPLGLSFLTCRVGRRTPHHTARNGFTLPFSSHIRPLQVPIRDLSPASWPLVYLWSPRVTTVTMPEAGQGADQPRVIFPAPRDGPDIKGPCHSS